MTTFLCVYMLSLICSAILFGVFYSESGEARSELTYRDLMGVIGLCVIPGINSVVALIASYALMDVLLDYYLSKKVFDQ